MIIILLVLYFLLALGTIFVNEKGAKFWQVLFTVPHLPPGSKLIGVATQEPGKYYECGKNGEDYCTALYWDGISGCSMGRCKKLKPFVIHEKGEEIPPSSIEDYWLCVCLWKAPECESHYEKRCYRGDVWWYDSCGNREEKYEECGEDETGEWSEPFCKDGDVYKKRNVIERGCSDGECYERTAKDYMLVEKCEEGYSCVDGECVEECESHYEKRCYEGDVWWYDSCGNREEKYEECGEKECVNGECVLGCEDECSRGEAKCEEDHTYWVCEKNGCWTWKNKGIVKGKCGVECMSNEDCPEGEVCKEYKCVSLECPVCPEPSEWSKCVDGKQTRTVWYCNETTGYKCVSYIEERRCGFPWGWVVVILIIVLIPITIWRMKKKI